VQICRCRKKNTCRVEEFLKIVTDSKEFLGIESLTKPRFTNRQKGRSDIDEETAYCKTNVYYPIIDHVLS